MVGTASQVKRRKQEKMGEKTSPPKSGFFIALICHKLKVMNLKRVKMALYNW